MSADLLRRAASLMRERAEVVELGPWSAGERCVWSEGSIAVVTDGPDGVGGTCDPDHAEHIASWHPAVALAVAESVDVALGWFDPEDCTEAEQAMHDALLTVARAYLGESS